ncbi:hypothetical protein FXO37_24630 [Capsicum annuum]|nr:hypothetical protein FXO37_24630 [Capsicum annuum]
MTFLSVAMNAVKAYFKRSWRRRDMMTLAKIPVHYHQNLRMVYRTHFWAMLCATVGSYLHLFWEVGGLFTVLCSVASLLCLCFTSPHRVRVRVSLLMITASSFGASVGLFTKYLFGIDQVYTAHWMLMVTAVLALFMGYFVVYSQEILYDARYGYIDFVNRTLTIFFRLPVIVVHAARLYLGVRVEQRRRHKIAWGAA